MKKKQEKIINNLFIGALVLVIIIYVASKNSAFAGMIPGNNTNPGGGSGGGSGSTPPFSPPMPTVQPAPSPSAPSAPSGAMPLPTVGETKILKRGDKNREVFTLQELYNSRIATPENRTRLVVDGVFGQNTENAIKYVTENTQTTITLQIWRVVTALNKAQRVAYFN